MIGTAEAGGGPLRSESARLPSVTLALAAPGPPVQLRWSALRVQGPTLRDAALANGGHGSPPVAPRLLPQPRPRLVFHSNVSLTAAGEWAPLERSCAVGILVAGRELERRYGQAADREREACGSIGGRRSREARGSPEPQPPRSHVLSEPRIQLWDASAGRGVSTVSIRCIRGSWRYSLSQAKTARI